MGVNVIIRLRLELWIQVHDLTRNHDIISIGVGYTGIQLNGDAYYFNYMPRGHNGPPKMKETATGCRKEHCLQGMVRSNCVLFIGGWHTLVKIPVAVRDPFGQNDVGKPKRDLCLLLSWAATAAVTISVLAQTMLNVAFVWIFYTRSALISNNPEQITRRQSKDHQSTLCGLCTNHKIPKTYLYRF